MINLIEGTQAHTPGARPSNSILSCCILVAVKHLVGLLSACRADWHRAYFDLRCSLLDSSVQQRCDAWPPFIQEPDSITDCLHSCSRLRVLLTASYHRESGTDRAVSPLLFDNCGMSLQVPHFLVCELMSGRHDRNAPDRHLLEGCSILFHFIKAVLLILQWLAAKAYIHLPQGQGNVLLLLKLLLLGLHHLQGPKPGSKLMQASMPVLQLPAQAT